MSDLITIHDKNGAEAITTTVERIIHELIALGELETIIQELVKAGAFDRVIHHLNVLRVMSTAKRLGDETGYNEAAKGYNKAFNAAVDNLSAKDKPVTAPKIEVKAAQRTDAKRCKDCGHLVLWLKGDEKPVPVFAENVGINEKWYNSEKHKTHYFNDCKRVKCAGNFKRPDGVTPEEQAQLFDK